MLIALFVDLQLAFQNIKYEKIASKLIFVMQNSSEEEKLKKIDFIESSYNLINSHCAARSIPSTKFFNAFEMSKIDLFLLKNKKNYKNTV